MKSHEYLPLMIIFALSVVSCSAPSKPDAPGSRERFDDPPEPEFSAVSVHDPSVFVSHNDGFYVIGSHLAAARTGDFITWQQVATDWRGRPNGFYPLDSGERHAQDAAQTMEAQINDVMRGSRHALGFYAGDIHRMPDGKFYHYYCITSSWYCSAIGLAVADAADGPYTTRGLLVRSGEAADNSMTPDGRAKWSVSQHPNCIDPQAFFDKDGERFFMTYGSWSGGIFLLELEPDTGALKALSAINAENNGYGRKLIRNNHVSIEGPYIIYSRETEYYYLFVSYGGLEAKGGYNMRVFRSRNPDGPYEDAAHPGTDMGNDMRFSEHASFGVKIMGGYQFVSLPGEEGSRTTRYLSPGHNSVYYDPAAGRYFLIYHQRFDGRGEYHEVRVCEMFLNEDAWFVAAPFRYDGGSVRSFNKRSVPGAWKLINHGTEINSEPALSAACQFSANGKISGPGGVSGKWELGKDGKTARIIVNGVLYKGVFLRCYDEDNKQWVQAFTALSENGVALWGAGAVAGASDTAVSVVK